MSNTSSQTRKTKLFFDSQVKVIGTLHLNDYTWEEIQRCWYNEEDLRTNYEQRRRKRRNQPHRSSNHKAKPPQEDHLQQRTVPDPDLVVFIH